MKRIVLLSLLLFPIFLFAQYPTFSNKQKLGVQTTGDGLIYRGRNNPNYYTPSNINNAYFYLDTLTSKLYLYNISDWQQIYPTTSDTTSLGNFLLKSDTLAMLLPYLRKTDTISLSNRINNKLNVTDTVSLSNRINLKLNQTDTINLSNRIDLKLNKSDTISLSNRINTKLNSSDTVSLSNRINTKLNSNDTISLSNRINKKLDTIYIQYQNYLDTIVNKDTINISNTLTEGFGINIIADSINIDSAVILTTQQKQIAYVKNESGVTMYKGQAVYSSGSNGNNKLVQLASSNTEQTSSKTFGVVESESIPNGQSGYIITFGLLDKINTDNLTEGSSIYLSTTPGQLTTTKPQAPLHLVTIGVCIRRQQNNGSIFVKIQNGFELDEIHDVRITSPVNNASLYYSGGLWRDTTATLLVSDTASMLSKYVNTYSNQTNINGDKTFNNTVTIDSATVTGKLLVNTNINDAVKITSNTNSTNLELMNNSGTVYIKSSNKNMILQTDTTALVYLNGNNKKVGILTMNPQQELEVNGNARITGLNNNLVPTNLVGSSNNNDLTNVHLGQGLSFSNDTLKVDLTIIDTAIAASQITLAGHVTGTGTTNSTVNTTISNNVVTNDMLTGGISDTKLNTITTAGKVDNSATTATSSNNPNTIVLRDASRNFTANNITANNFYGLASTSTIANSIQSNNTTGIIKLTTSSNSVLPILTVPDDNATIATTNLNQTFGGTQTFSNTIVGNISGNASTVTSVTPSNFASQTANTILAAPNGLSGTPSFRSLVSADIPNLNYLPLTGGTTSGLITSSFSNTNNYSTSAEDNNSFTIYNNTTSTNNIYGGLKFLIGQNSGAIPGGPGLAQIYAIRAGGASNPSTDLSFLTKSSVSGILEKMRIKFDGKVGIGTSTPNYLLDVNGQIGSTGFFKSGGLSTEFLKADGSVDANTYLTTGTASSTYLPLTGGTISGSILNSWTPAYSSAPRNDGAVRRTYTQNLYSSAGNTTDRVIHYYTFSQDECCASAPVTMYYGRFNGFYNQANIIYDASIYYHRNNQFYYRAFSEPENKVTFSIKPSTTVNSISGTKADLYLSGDAQIDRSLNIGTTLGVTGATNISNTLSATTGTFTALNINNTTTEGVLTIKSANFNTASRIEFGDGSVIRKQINYASAYSNLDFRTLAVGGGEGGYSFYTRRNPNAEILSFVIDRDGNSNFYGTLGVTGATTLSSLSGTGNRMVTASSTGVLSTQAIPTGTLVGTDTVSLSNRINTKVGLTGNETINGTKTFGGLIVPTNGMMLTATGNNSNKLIGINASTFVGEVTLGSGLSLSNNVLSATSTGTVTSVSGSGAISSTGGTTPVISVASAANGVSGIVTNQPQEFSGNKHFLNNLTVNGVSNFSSEINAGFNITGTNVRFSSYPAGTLSVNGSGVVTSSSDSTLKIADGYIDSALVKINKLTPRYYYWKDNKFTNRQLGFFAQEVNSILGEEAAPTPTNGNKYGIYDISIVAYLVKAVQEQQVIIDTLKSEIDKIKEDIVKLKQN